MDNNTAANAAISASIARDSVKSAKCRDCGTHYVAWVTSKRTGRNYLADAIAGTAGKVIPAAHRPHFKTCLGKIVGTVITGRDTLTGAQVTGRAISLVGYHSGATLSYRVDHNDVSVTVQIPNPKF